jgi:hypothetical protein
MGEVAGVVMVVVLREFQMNWIFRDIYACKMKFLDFYVALILSQTRARKDGSKGWDWVVNNIAKF